MQYNKTAKSGHLGEFRCPQKSKKFRSIYPLEFSGFMDKRPRSIVSPSGLVVRKCHFDVTACAEARRLDKCVLGNGQKRSKATGRNYAAGPFIHESGKLQGVNRPKFRWLRAHLFRFSRGWPQKGPFLPSLWSIYITIIPGESPIWRRVVTLVTISLFT